MDDIGQRDREWVKTGRYAVAAAGAAETKAAAHVRDRAKCILSEGACLVPSK